MAIIFDGRQKAKEILEEIKLEVDQRISKPSLLILRTGKDESQLKFTEIKKRTAEKLGIICDIIEYPSEAATDHLIDTIKQNSDKYTGILVQLPLPSQIDQNNILNSIPFDKDVEGLSKERFELLYEKVPDIYSPVAKAAVETTKDALTQLDRDITQQNIAVVGESYLIGKPVSLVLKKLGGNINMCNSKTLNTKSIISEADIVISGVGKPNFIKPDYIKKGSILIDTGFEIDENDHIAGDIDPEAAKKSEFYTPVPGGIGPLTVAYIFDNLLCL